jgi:hypothetical protein
LVVSTTLLCGNPLAQGRSAEYFVVPWEVAPCAIAYQPGSPIEFKGVEFRIFVEGGSQIYYRIHNKGGKPIVAYRVETINTAGTGSGERFRAQGAEKWFMPGQTWPEVADAAEGRLSPSDALLKKYKIGSSAVVITILMAVRVEFADGTAFNDEPAYERLRNFLERNSIEPEEPNPARLGGSKGPLRSPRQLFLSLTPCQDIIDD